MYSFKLSLLKYEFVHRNFQQRFCWKSSVDEIFTLTERISQFPKTPFRPDPPPQKKIKNKKNY